MKGYLFVRMSRTRRSSPGARSAVMAVPYVDPTRGERRTTCRVSLGPMRRCFRPAAEAREGVGVRVDELRWGSGNLRWTRPAGQSLPILASRSGGSGAQHGRAGVVLGFVDLAAGEPLVEDVEWILLPRGFAGGVAV